MRLCVPLTNQKVCRWSSEVVRIVTVRDFKYCPACDATHPIADFPRNRARYDGLGSVCRRANRRMQREWYARNAKRHSQRVADRRRTERRANHQRIRDYLSGHGCEVCGETDVVVLEFHHLDRNKEYDISEMVSKGYSWASIMRELRKCQVLCANDHRRITAQQRSWYRAQAVTP